MNYWIRISPFLVSFACAIDPQAYSPHIGGRCPLDQFDCNPQAKERFCVPFPVVRDCFPDCPNGEDERCGLNLTLCDKERRDEPGCGKCVLKQEINKKCLDRKWQHLCAEKDVFHCKSNQNCVPNDWLNDGDDDCGDGSDENPCDNGTVDCKSRIMATSSTPSKPPEREPPLHSAPASDCAELLALNPGISSSIYKVYDWSCTDRLQCPFSVYCDNEFGGGGWTMVMKRWDDSMSFNRSWQEYRHGFGNVSRGDDFWIGNDRLHSLTAKRNCPTEMIVRMQPVGTNQPLIVAKYASLRSPMSSTNTALLWALLS